MRVRRGIDSQILRSWIGTTNDAIAIRLDQQHTTGAAMVASGVK
jgi:hypothetical protein